jgi:hypothetical protein
MERRDFIWLALVIGLLMLLILQLVGGRQPVAVDDRTLPPPDECPYELPPPDGQEHALPTVDPASVPVPLHVVTPAAGSGGGFG